MPLSVENLRAEEKVVLREIFSPDEPEVKTFLAAILSVNDKDTNKNNHKDKQSNITNSNTHKLKHHSSCKDESEEEDEEEEWSEDDYAVIKAYYENEEENEMDFPNLVGLSSTIQEQQVDISNGSDSSNKTDSKYCCDTSTESVSFTATSSHDSCHKRNGQHLRQQKLAGVREVQRQIENHDSNSSNIAYAKSDPGTSAAIDLLESDPQHCSKNVEIPDEQPARKKSKR